MKDQLLWKSDLGSGNYKNPILFADYSDPDVIRVGDRFYMTASSFNYTPGLPILVSEDLVNWQLVNYAILNLPYEMYNVPQHSKGVWAPSIRYRKGRFYIYFGMPDNGIFVVHTEDPLGEWSKPVLILEGKGYIDPCPFWEDGRAYIVHGYAKSRIGFKSFLGAFEISEDGLQVIGRDRLIYDGRESQPTIEGPKIYRRNGYYYIFAPAGGVKNGWQTVLRGKELLGPYEEKIVMYQGDTMINGPHQGALVDTEDGEEWFVHFQDRGAYGRITHLQPVQWVNNWPVIGVKSNEDGCGQPCLVYRKPKVKVEEAPTYLQASDDFRESDLNLLWQWMGNHKRNFYDLISTDNKSCLRLYSLNTSGQEQPILWTSSNVLTQKIICPEFLAEIKINIEDLQDEERAGCILMGGKYAFLAVTKHDGKYSLVYGQSEEDQVEDQFEESQNYGGLGQMGQINSTVITERILVKKDMPENIRELKLRIQMNKNLEVTMAYQMPCLDSEWLQVDYIFVPQDHTWVGAKIGLFAQSKETDNSKEHGYADFEYIRVS